MRFVVYGEERRLGVIAKDGVVDVQEAMIGLQHQADSKKVTALAPTSNLLEFIVQGSPAVDLVQEALYRFEHYGHEPKINVELHAPWPGKRMICGGANHPVHMSRALTAMGRPITPTEYAALARREGLPGFFKAIAEPVGPGGIVHMPEDDVMFDYEGELVIVIGRSGKNITPDNYMPYVWGVTLICDWGVRDMVWPSSPDPFNKSKNFDDSVSIGPCILVDPNVNPDRMPIQTRVNEELRQDFSTSEFSLSFGEILAGLTRRFSVVPGDLLTAGSGPGTVMDTVSRSADGTWPRDKFLQPGDEVEVSSPLIGKLAASIAPYDRFPASSRTAA